MSGALSDVEKLDWLQLIRSENVGPRTFSALLAKFGSARSALDAMPDLAPRTSGRAVRIADRDTVEREWENSARRGIVFVGLREASYPLALRAIDAPPPLLAVRGRVDTLARAAVAIVGSRNASAAGLTFAERLARGLGEAELVTVSGLARGIDAIVHRASLRRGTVAVLAGGHAKPYPPENVSMLDAIAETGAILSEMPLEWEPRGRDFPRRNRIVSGLSVATVVVEAARRSGSLITARFASEQGREVFAVPGSPLDPRAEGTNDLIRSGATLCSKVDDVLEVIRPLLDDPRRAGDLFAQPNPVESSTGLWDEADLFAHAGGPGTPAWPLSDDDGVPASDLPVDAVDGARQQVIGLLGPAPVSLDDLVRLTQLRVGEIQSVLLDLELDGRLERHGGNLVSLPR